jgi:hypothetical protein
MPPQLQIRKPTPVNPQMGPDVPAPDPMTMGAPMPPQPTSPAAGFQAWVADPMNQAKVPAPVPAKTPLIPTQQEYFQQHPEQEQTPLLMGRRWTGLAQGLFAALQDIGRPGAGSERLQGLMQHDINIPQTNAQIYRAGAVQPVLDQTSVQQAQNVARKTGYEADIEGNRAQLGPMADPQIQEFYNTVAKNKNELAQLWQSGQYTPEQFDKVVQSRMSANPYMARFVDPGFIQQVKGLPQQPPSFKVQSGTLEPLTYRGAVYGPNPTPGEPQEISAARTQALASRQLGEPSEKLQMDDYLAKNPGKGPSDFVAWKAKQSPMAMVMGNQLSPEALAMAADLYAKTGQLPSMGRSVGSISAVIDQAAKQNPGGSIAENKVAQGAYAEQAKKAQPQFVAFDTANQHLGRLMEAAKALNNGDVRALNGIANAYGVAVGQDPVTTFKAITTVAGPEIVKASASTGQMSQEEIQQARSNFSPDMALNQLVNNGKAMQDLMAGKKTSLQHNLEQLKGGDVTGGAAQPSNGGSHVIEVNGKHYRYKGTGDTADMKNYSEVK